jgi:hypothetical protein
MKLKKGLTKEEWIRIAREGYVIWKNRKLTGYGKGGNN